MKKLVALFRIYAGQHFNLICCIQNNPKYRSITILSRRAARIIKEISYCLSIINKSTNAKKLRWFNISNHLAYLRNNKLPRGNPVDKWTLFIIFPTT